MREVKGIGDLHVKLSEKIKNALARRRKWLKARAFLNCMLVSMGVLFVSYIFELTHMIIVETREVTFPFNLFYFWVAWLLFSSMLWVLSFLFPDMMEVFFKMLGFESNKEEKSSKHT